MGERRKRKPPPPSSSALLSDPPAAVAEHPSLRSTGRYRRASCRWLEGQWEMELAIAPRRRHGTRVQGREGGSDYGRWRWGGGGRQMGRGGSDGEMRCCWGKLGDCDQTLSRVEGIDGGTEEEEARHEGSGERRRRQLREVEEGRPRQADEERRRRENALGGGDEGMRRYWGSWGTVTKRCRAGKELVVTLRKRRRRRGTRVRGREGGGVCRRWSGCGRWRMREKRRGGARPTRRPDLFYEERKNYLHTDLDG